MISDELFISTFYLAKNLVLSGVKSLIIHDKSPVVLSDFSAQYYLKTSHLGQARDAATVDSLADLNRSVGLSVYPHAEIANADVASFNVIINIVFMACF